MGLTFQRHFTQPGTLKELRDRAKKVTSRITRPDGTVVFEAHDIEVPEQFSQTAADVFAQKYCKRTKEVTETSFFDVVDRIVDALYLQGLTQKYFDEENGTIWAEELKFLLIQQYGAFNSPVWFNCGLWEKYGLKRPSAGNWAYNFETGEVEPCTDAYSRPQLSACFIQSIDDDLMDIAEHIQREMRLFKYGSGSGTNFSQIRAAGEPLSAGGTSSGLMSFLEVFDKAAGATKSGGTTRRAAKMVCLDVDHPDIMEFIEWKSREEDKALALISAGYSSDYEGEAYRTVSGQNSNNSVRLSDAFMRAVEEDGEWVTTYRTTGQPAKRYKARDIFRKTAKSAWRCADPGLHFSDTMNAWHTSPEGGEIKATNPCAEFCFIDNSSCNLASLNLVKFATAEDTDFRTAVYVFAVGQDLIVDYASYPTKEIAERSHRYRPLGLGFANIGGHLMRRGIPYDSDEGRQIAASFASEITAGVYRASIDINYTTEVQFIYGFSNMPAVVDMHVCAAADRELSMDVWGYVLDCARYIRNAQASVTAPTGTIGLLMDCDTTGIEPDFALTKYKKLAGGGTFKIVNAGVEEGLRSLNIMSADIPEILATLEATGEFPEWSKPLIGRVFDCANDISPMGHLKMVAAVQPLISGASSKTINLPNSATVEDIEHVYKEAYKLGVKCVAVYRDGCKASQPLSSVKPDTGKEGTGERVEAAPPTEVGPARPRRKRLPKKRRGFTQEAKVAGHKVYLRTGEYEDGTLGEVFIDMHREGAAFRSIMNCLAIAVSLGLQYGVPLEEYVNAFVFTRFEPQGVVDHPNIKQATSVIDYIFRVLGMEYNGRTDFVQVKPAISPELSPEDDEEEQTGDNPFCPTCGSVTIRNGTCYRCLNCGSTTGCS